MSESKVDVILWPPKQVVAEDDEIMVQVLLAAPEPVRMSGLQLAIHWDHKLLNYYRGFGGDGYDWLMSGVWIAAGGRPFPDGFAFGWAQSLLGTPEVAEVTPHTRPPFEVFVLYFTRRDVSFDSTMIGIESEMPPGYPSAIVSAETMGLNLLGDLGQCEVVKK